jgi:hypothetical protein
MRRVFWRDADRVPQRLERTAPTRRSSFVSVREPRLPSSWMPSSVHDCDNSDELWKDAIHHEIGKFAEQSQTSVSVNDWEGVRLPRDQIETQINCAHELASQPSAPSLVPERGFSDIGLRLVARNDEQAHRLARMRSRAMCQGVPLSGCASSASSRRSSSVICSGERSIAGDSSAILSHSSLTNWIRSGIGSCRNS